MSYTKRAAPATWRDIILFVAGLAGIINEAVLRDVERPTLLILYAAMVGLPTFLRADKRGNNDVPS